MLGFSEKATVFTGLSELKTSIAKSKRPKITYRDYKNFDYVRFNEELT